jgi:hypothetical protein
MIALMFLYASVYLLCSEYISLQPLRGEILLYRKSLIPGRKLVDDAEHQGSALRMAQSSPSSHGESRHDGNLGIIRNEAATFVWNELNYQIKIGKTTKDILFDVEGWVRPGTLTALMVCPRPKIDVRTTANLTRAPQVPERRHYSMY